VEFCKEKLIQLQSNASDNLYSDGFKAKGEGIPLGNDSKYNEKSCDTLDADIIITGQDNVQEIDMQRSRMNVTSNQKKQTIQKSWKMNVSSIVSVDNINSISSCNYDQANNSLIHNTITKDTKNFENLINSSSITVTKREIED